MKRVPELDALRFIAIAAVIAAHYRPAFSQHYWFLSFGWMGVDLFFAISGFLITTILIRLREVDRPFRTFYARRILRIFPPYYLLIILIILLAMFHVGVVPYRRLAAAITFYVVLQHTPIQRVVSTCFPACAFHHTCPTPRR